MASLRSKSHLPIGSAQWVQNESDQANQFIGEEVEEFSFSARNEMEWLNEHMAEIFSRSQLNVTEVFKTPGKLRGKTPRTARKKNPLEARAPLTDIFAPSPQAGTSPSQRTNFYKQVAQFQVAEDPQQEQHESVATGNKHSVGAGKGNADSGYHGMPEDEMDLDRAPREADQPTPQKRSPEKTTWSVQAPTPRQSLGTLLEQRRATDESFVSAEEALGSRHLSKEDLLQDDDDNTTVLDEETGSSESQPAPTPQQQAEQAVSPHPTVLAEEAAALDRAQERAGEQDPTDDHLDVNGSRTPSDGSSPVKPLVRKSSLTFASLPAREPLTTKKSMGTRTSYVEQQKMGAVGRGSHVGRFAGGKSFGDNQQALPDDADDEVDAMDVDEQVRPGLPREESETTKVHNKSTTQRLHERINMLGQSKEPRSSKSIPKINVAAATQPSYPQLPDLEQEEPQPEENGPEVPPKDVVVASANQDDDDDDWIAPIKTSAPVMNHNRPQPSASHTADPTERIDREPSTRVSVVDSPTKTDTSARPIVGIGHQKSTSTTALASPTKTSTAPDVAHKKTISCSNPDFSTAQNLQTTTPAGSPIGKRYMDGPLSASKAKLYSVLKSAKGIFASSAGVSAQAKMEALSTAVPQPADRTLESTTIEVPIKKQDSAQNLYPDLRAEAKSVTGDLEKASEGRRTRSSSENERKRVEEAKKKQQLEDEIENARNKERQNAANQKVPRSKINPAAYEQEREGLEINSRAESDAMAQQTTATADEMPPPPPLKSMLPTGSQLQKPRETRRLAKPSKETLPRAKPVPVSIRVASQSQRIGQIAPTNLALSASLQDSLPPAPPSKAPLPSKPSAASLQSSTSTNSFKSSVSTQSTRPKALEAAAKKKEQEEKAAQRKAEQKRELDQKRATKIEEERLLEQQRRAAEQQRVQEAKKAAQKQAEARKAELQRQQALPPRTRQANDLATALQNEKAQGPSAHHRGDLGHARSVSRMNTVQDMPRPITQPQINPAKPPKRVFQPDTEDEPGQRPTLQRAGPSYQQQDAKRRKTIDEDDEDDEPRRSVMAPPIRHSNIRKEPLNKFPHGYTHAPPATSHVSSMFKSTVTAQHQLQHPRAPAHPNDMATFSKAKIPFAEAPNPPAASSNHHQMQVPLKTPGPAKASKPSKSVKSSPAYPQGDSIQLPDINTDSEDSDSDDENDTGGFAAPSWVNSPALRELLTQQQLMDPEAVFGPIAPLQMEEVFSKNKDRMKRFRDRTSSANWAISGDALTQEERDRDREGREAVVRQGEWRFGNGGV
ncbi:hypothetical protein B0A49_02331 [Cryomyces minteri]|uniref:Inner centromere protein ARK-binding domain-containing protein n=2 Tax=Cryomyces minteri TaxID=331657 RepID=A0A4V5NH38_9PEZI|nr:hypothetical protein B0A49_02331 [Cryomyces minteri]